MRQRNRRIVIVRGVLLAASVTYSLRILSMAPKSNNPVTMMRSAGQVAGIVGGLSIATIRRQQRMALLRASVPRMAAGPGGHRSRAAIARPLQTSGP